MRLLFELFIFIVIFIKFSLTNKFIFYDVSTSEGFNLRRDVYIRVVNFCRLLKKFNHNITLVLPPWRHLYHWHSDKSLLWEDVFDMNSLNQVIKVIDFENFNIENKRIDFGFILRNHPNLINGDFSPKADFVKCNTKLNKIFDKMLVRKSICIDLRMDIDEFSSVIHKFFRNHTSASYFYFHDSEKLVHGTYSEWSAEYWTVRRSMRFNSDLRRITNEYRSSVFHSDNIKDRTVEPIDWRAAKWILAPALGGSYIGVHLRRQDFIASRELDFPSLDEVVNNITWFCHKYNLFSVFIATDSDSEDRQYLIKAFKERNVNVFYFHSNVTYHPGQLAIIDQLICAYSRVFVGTYQSTFTFRIFEERQIMGFNTLTTYNYICPERLTLLNLEYYHDGTSQDNEDKEDCSRATIWPVVYEHQYTIEEDKINHPTKIDL